MSLTVAYLTSRMPYPPLSGGQRREYELLHRLSRRAKVHLMVVTRFPREDAEGIDELESLCESVTMLPARAPSRTVPRVPERLAGQACPAMLTAINRLLGSTTVDLVHVEGYYMLQHAGGTALPIALVEENIEFALDRQRASLGMSPDADWSHAREIERAAWRRATVCGALTPEDLAVISSLEPQVQAIWCPNGFEHDVVGECAGAGRAKGSSPVVTMFGSYSYPPTEDAALFLLEDLWPRVLERGPRDLRLQIVGASATDEILKRAAATERVEIVGLVPTVNDAYRDTAIAVAPIRIGGGVKVKVLEAIARRCPVVATPLGAEGLPLAVRQGMAIAQHPEDLAHLIVELAGNREERMRLSALARDGARVLPTWAEAAEHLWKAWMTALNAR